MSDPARDAYRGFEYQIHATVWLFLDLVFRRGASAVAHVEPLHGQDLELAKPETSAPAEGRAVRLDMAGTERWIIQVKTRSTDYWSKADLERIVEGETARKKDAPARFPSPATLLDEDPNCPDPARPAA